MHKKYTDVVKNLKSLGISQSSRLKKIIYGIVEQVFSVAAVFLANILLARSGTASEYGNFTLIYTIFTLFSAVHNALLLEPYTVFASGRYRRHFADYLQHVLRINFAVGLVLALILFLLTGGVFLISPSFYNPAMIGLAAGVMFLLTGAFFRRVFYVELDSASAARMSVFYFLVVCLGLAVLFYGRVLSGFSVFLLLALGWIAVSPLFFRTHRILFGAKSFLSDHPAYWRDHWRYSRWVLVTALIFQLTNQGYFWIVGGLLTLEDVAKLKAVQNIVLPVTVVFNSLSFFLLPRMSMIFQHQSAKGLIPIVKTVILLILGFAITFFILLLFKGKEILDLIYAGKYTSSVDLLWIIGLTPIVLGVGNVLNDAIKSMEQPKWVFYAYIVSGVITLALGVPMIISFGLVGAAWGIVTSALAYMLLLIYGFIFVSRHYSRQDFERLESPTP